MPTLTDQMGRTVAVPAAPQRIISLVPSQTELLFDLGLGDEIAGVTKFCVHPAPQVKQKPSVGGTKKFRFDVIDRLQPDLIIGNKEENYREGIERLAAQYPVWMSDIVTLADALAMMRAVGGMVGRADAAETLAAKIEAGFAALPKLSRPWRTAYLIWQKPFMAAGTHTFIHHMLTRCGCLNAVAPAPRYPEITAGQLRRRQLDLLLLSSEPFPFGPKHQAQLQTQFPDVRIELVDGEMFSWYGSRLLTAVTYLQQLIHRLDQAAPAHRPPRPPAPPAAPPAD